MNFYFSGIETFKNGSLKDSVISVCDHRLQSCHGAYVRTTMDWMARTVSIGAACNQVMMLDSGAFTAWSKGHTMTLQELLPVYSDIAKMYSDKFKDMWFINLDVIPGSRDRKPTPSDIEEALHVSDENFSVLESEFGKRILPVYHQGEELSRLLELEEESQYICISPRQTLSEKVRVAWLDHISARARKDRSYHGLATTGARSIIVNDWHSVDSASWVMVGAMGNILLPIKGWVKPLSVSDDSPNLKIQGKHISNLSFIEYEHVSEIIHSHGFTVEELVENHSHRMAFNFFIIRDAIKSLAKKTGDQPSLFEL